MTSSARRLEIKAIVHSPNHDQGGLSWWKRGGRYITDVTFTIELEREEDGRWIAEVPGLPGVLCYGQDRGEAVAGVQALDRLGSLQFSSLLAGHQRLCNLIVSRARLS